MIDKGSERNPFENVNEAIEYIIQLEKIISDNDPYFEICRQEYNGICLNMNLQLMPKWLWPNVAMICEGLDTKSFVVSKLRSGKFAFKPVMINRKFLFRGQTQDYSTCVPTLFRDEKQDYYLKDMILNHEMCCLIESHPLVQLLGIKGVKLNGLRFQMSTNYGGICQHYANRTPYLDFTSDVDVAKFFATTDFVGTECKPHIDDGIGVIYCHEIQMPQAFQQQILPDMTFVHLSVMGKQIFPRSGAQFGFLFDMPKGLDYNELKNVRKFYFKHDSEISKTLFSKSKEGYQYMPPSILDEYWIEKMSNSQTDRVISRNAFEINYQLNKEMETKSSLEKKLKRLGFTISNRIPSFNPDQLSSYYQDIRNGWWEDVFCNDIYFYGEEGRIYQDAFRALRKDLDNSFAFNENATRFDYKFDVSRFVSL